MSDRFGALKAENASILIEIDREAAAENHDQVIALKKRLYSNKLEMLDLLTAHERRAGITAKALREKVGKMKKLPRYATGVQALDAVDAFDGGIEVGSLILFGGASGTGKSHLTLEIVCNIASYSTCVFFNLEMGERRLSNRLERQLKTESQWNNLIVDSFTRKLDDIVMEIKLHASDGAKFFVIDSRMKIDIPGEKQEYLKIAQVTKTLSAICQQFDLIIFLINQISEDDLKTSRLAFKGSGDQLYDADIALFYVQHPEDENKRKLICSKNRQDERRFSVDLILDKGGNTVYADAFRNIKPHTYAEEKISMAIL